LNIDKSLSTERQLEMMLAYPDLTETDKLMLKMKYKRD